MKIFVKHDDRAARAIASRWNLTLKGCVSETIRARVYQADGPYGPSALKLYREVGSSGEGASVQFLRNLDPSVGVKVHRCNAMRTVVLMEWLEGPTLDELVAQGDDAQAIKHLGKVAYAVASTNFKFPIIYRRMVPALRRDFAKCSDPSASHAMHQELQQSTALLDHLAQTTQREHVIHGDLAFSNVILTAEGPRLIDPKGLRADPAFDLAKAMVLPYDEVPIPEFIKRVESRATAFAMATGIPPLRLIQWSAVVLGHRTIYGSRKRPKFSGSLPYLKTLLDMAER